MRGALGISPAAIAAMAVSAPTTHVPGGTSMTPPRLWLPPSYRELQEAMRRNGLLKLLTWSDLTGEPIERHQLEQLAASCPAETLIAFASMGSILYANRIRNPVAMRDDQVGAVREMAPESALAGCSRYIAVSEARVPSIYRAC